MSVLTDIVRRLGMRRSAAWLLRVPVHHLLLMRTWLIMSVSRQKTIFSITECYGRTGNNIQQLLVLISHAERFGGECRIDEKVLQEWGLDETIAPFQFDFRPAVKASRSYSGVMFYYSELGLRTQNPKRWVFNHWDVPRRDSLLGRRWMDGNLHRIGRTYLGEHLHRHEVEEVPSDVVVLCLRAGDVSALDHRYYLTNPLCFYRRLASMYRKVIVITEPEKQHMILDDITTLFEDSEVRFIPFAERAKGFEIMLRATHLATSGVSTYPMAAALLSSELRTFHCTELYMDEHVNPRMFDREIVDVQEMKLPGFVRSWRKSTDKVRFLREYMP